MYQWEVKNGLCLAHPGVRDHWEKQHNSRKILAGGFGPPWPSQPWLCSALVGAGEGGAMEGVELGSGGS